MEKFADEAPVTGDCTIKLRLNPQKRKEKVVIGCGAGFGGDRPLAALKLLQRVKELDYLVLECLAERTLAERCSAIKSGGKGYDPRVSDWMELLLPLSVERGVCIITNMGAKSPHGAQEEVLQVASKLGIRLTVGLAFESSVLGVAFSEVDDQLKHADSDVSIYLGAAPIVECLERYKPDVVITSRVADASLFLAPMVFELGWNWNDWQLLAQGSLAGHLLECGCQLTGGYYMHPGDKHRNMSFYDLLDISLPFAEVTFDGKVCVAKPDCSGGVLNFSTCAEQLLYEVGDPGAYFTPDVIVDFLDVTFQPLSRDRVLCSGAKATFSFAPQQLLMLRSKENGWKGWGEISYGGHGAIQRAKPAEFLVRAWMEESCPGKGKNIISYIIGLDSLKASLLDDHQSNPSADIRLRMDGLFEEEEHAFKFIKEFIALYTNGPAGGGGISTGSQKELLLQKELIGRENVYWQVSAARNNLTCSAKVNHSHQNESRKVIQISNQESSDQEVCSFGAPTGQEISLYNVAHSRAGDKGNDLNFSLIPHYPPDIKKLKMIVTQDWVKKVVSKLLNPSSFPNAEHIARRDEWIREHVKVEIYEVRGIHSLNVVVRNILDGGVNCSRRIDRHGKTISDLVLSQKVVLPP